MKTNNENSALIYDLDLADVNESIDKHALSVNETVLSIVNKVTKELDVIVAEIRERLNQLDTLPTEQLEIFALRLSTELFYIGQSQEYMGLRMDVSKAVYKDKFNYFYQRIDGTINDKTAYSEAHVMTEMLAMSVSERAYRRVKIKIENSQDIINSIKKILSRRIAEYELTKNDEITLQSGIDNRNRLNVVRRAR